MTLDQLTEEIIGAMIEVHRELSAGLLESAYEECLCHELTLRDLKHRRQVFVPVRYKGLHLDCGYRVDVLVDEAIVLEIKSVKALEPIHDAQLITYLKLGGWPIGLLANFNVRVLKDGIRRKVNNYTS
jgi:GxxExxY protein